MWVCGDLIDVILRGGAFWVNLHILLTRCLRVEDYRVNSLGDESAGSRCAWGPPEAHKLHPPSPIVHPSDRRGQILPVEVIQSKKKRRIISAREEGRGGGPDDVSILRDHPQQEVPPLIHQPSRYILLKQGQDIDSRGQLAFVECFDGLGLCDSLLGEDLSL